MLVVGECASNGRSVSAMSREEKIVEAMRRSAPLLPSELGQAVESLLTPETAFLIGGTLGAWAVSHIFGIGEILDLLLLVVGVVTLGKSAWDLAHLLRDFAATALAARTDPDLDRAAQLFARAVVLGGARCCNGVAAAP